MPIPTLATSLKLPNQKLLFDLDELYSALRRVKDRRKKRGVRYPLAEILLIGVLAKLAGQTSSRAMASWARLRQQELSALFGLQHRTMPHFSTWSRILGTAIDPQELEEVLGTFFASYLPMVTQPGERHVCIDGKTLRRTIPLGKTKGVHLLAAYLPKEGVVLSQVQVPATTSEVKIAPKLLACLDLRANVVSGDATFASRKLSQQILESKGDFLWTLKKNQHQMYQDLEVLFSPPTVRPGWSAPPTDFRSASSLGKAHGRVEKRRITVSSLLSSYSKWPGLSQVFRLERERTNTLGETEREVAYGLTSLPASVATPKRLLALVREHWEIENGLHYRRDQTLREDWSQLRMGHAPQMLAALNNTALGLIAHQGEANIPQAQRRFAYQLDRDLARLAG